MRLERGYFNEFIHVSKEIASQIVCSRFIIKNQI